MTMNDNGNERECTKQVLHEYHYHHQGGLTDVVKATALVVGIVPVGVGVLVVAAMNMDIGTWIAPCTEGPPVI